MSLLYPGVDDEDAMQWYQELHSGIPEAPPPPPPPPPPHPSESWGTVGSGHGTPKYWDADSDGYWTGADMEILSELGISPWAMKTYDPSYMKWQDSYNDNTISGKPYDPTLYNLDDVNARNRNSTIQYWMDRGRPDIYSQPDLMTENLYTSLLGGVVEDGMWVKGSQQ
tara:strand:+ start:180 stop:683 length:504 start_codon:yes stop_codon:yes gene_type:complete